MAPCMVQYCRAWHVSQNKEECNRWLLFPARLCTSDVHALCLDQAAVEVQAAVVGMFSTTDDLSEPILQQSWKIAKIVCLICLLSA